MKESENKLLIQNILSELSKGDYTPFFEAMADEMKWTWMGTDDLSKTFNGKEAVVNELWASVKISMIQPYRIVIKRLIAEGDYVVVEALGENSTPDGKKYNNKYCWVCYIVEGKLREVNEYMDTELVKKTFN